MSSEYDDISPEVWEHANKFRRALDAVRLTHRGRPVGEIRQALVKECEAEGIKPWNEVLDDAAYQVSIQTD
ncbi:hypothetical protein [Saccharothrix syringae]|uniref:Uncharacterized protein n=1 Tax=Saccharothrix syringae TaxID=103733 RepID=A0A5Q0GXB2_SACSY|nr:hypothetical protein [Saccharothrix syringae]QFZ18619.1 hypothetical protein EKG83_15140 [Saccharothrix syringae]